jgi:hypothetical protein
MNPQSEKRKCPLVVPLPERKAGSGKGKKRDEKTAKVNGTDIGRCYSIGCGNDFQLRSGGNLSNRP